MTPMVEMNLAGRRTDPNAPLVEIKKLCVSFQTSAGEVRAVRDLDLTIYPCLLYTSPSPRD